PRPARPSFVDEVRRPMPPALPERRSERSDPLTGFSPESLGGRPEPRPEPQRTIAAPPPIPSPPPISSPPISSPQISSPSVASPSLSAADQNLAEMAQRLEAALRRRAGETAAEPRIGAPPVAPEAPLGRSSPRSDPSMAP